MSGLLAASSLWLGLGLLQSVDDPFAVQRGLQLGLGLRARPWLEVRVDGAAMPAFSNGITRSLRSMSTGLQVHPDLAPVRVRGQLTADLLAWRGDGEGLQGEAGLRVGAGMLRTVDDPDWEVFGPDDGAFLATREQWHPTPVLGAVGAVGRGAWRLETRVEWTAYTEVVQAVIFEEKQHCWVGLGLGRRLGPAGEGTP